MQLNYKEQLADSRWLQKKAEILIRDNYTCQKCGIKSHLNVHHKHYESGKLAWEYPDEVLVTLCRDCHENEHEIVPYPKVGKIYKFHHSDYENDMLCYFVDNKRKYVYLFGVDNGAYGTPYIFSVPMNDFVMRFRNSSLSFDDKSIEYDSYTVKSFLLALEELGEKPNGNIPSHPLYPNDTHFAFTLTKIKETINMRKDILNAINNTK